MGAAVARTLRSRFSSDIPLLEPWGKHRGNLLEALLLCGVVFITGWPSDDLRSYGLEYGRWHNLWLEARTNSATLNARTCVKKGLLRIGGREDLQRTLDGYSR